MDSLNEMEMKLWDYIDGFAAGEERTAIEKLIAEHSEWRLKYQELLKVHESLHLAELEQPSLRFTKNVMEEIAKNQIAPAAKSFINNRIIWGIGSFFLATILACLVYGFAQIDWSAASSEKGSFGLDLGKVDYMRMFNNNFVNVFMLLNVVLGLMLLDRYLSNRNKKLKKA